MCLQNRNLPKVQDSDEDDGEIVMTQMMVKKMMMDGNVDNDG